ncbi:enoyl-CoA hydratase/isomerase family protein [Pseudooceanicola batsensis HTCC2597]|uniref:3-hydroxyisobutyryl-CoA hydrolase n=1 Tax=Pseudooceanicola batsensis (strain ATCC BAA-863 / DSM 15984 / KCTC 12145 / HTCC2597) TaxID=252305 RepID=A3U2T9_PSEBH|nr:enoyl-CoA hydratase/isomerase family protein [Pseudooceanicola batsensis]EAQ01469.1 enoyl-CoA hydratase/isomerase family protein [Pseudooceanicola batsensis HTCC2597]
MSEGIDIRVVGRAGRITLNRPKALNALTYDMAMGIDAALRDWAGDDRVRVVVIDAEGDKAFCAGGDIQKLYETGKAGDFAFGQRFWRDEYRMNARLARFPKPIVSLMQGFVMGGGVGVGCHLSHRVVEGGTQIAMPECGIGLVPDVGGSLLLARAPGRLGAYLGLTAARMGPGDAIRAGFADFCIPRDRWAGLTAEIEESGDPACLAAAQVPDQEAPLAAEQAQIDRLFRGDLPEIMDRLEAAEGEFAAATLKAMRRNSPLAMAVTLAMLDRLAGVTDLREALRLEYRYTARSMEHGDFLEGIRAQIIDRDRNPQWREGPVDTAAAEAMLAPLSHELTFEEE